MKKKKSTGREIFEWIVMICSAIILALIIKTFLLSSTLVSGVSMEPTLETNDKLFVNKVSFLVDNVERGDIVEFHNPNNEGEDFIKRVIGIEGDIVEIRDNKVYVNGNMLKEDYTSSNGETIYYNENRWEIGKGKVFVLGDNRPRSNDSRSFGPISKKSIVGIAFFRYSPLSKIGKI
ncbi:signal peptidase I [Miniphocaeibacter massiliensis]|uniref:signal peptidase I n=1 Tax=Miniphocaeibacter massiliensis TaxID=2041841 RepID=UPI000C085D75|nr:signal peptidase I [Miniphocaeibacter massiliensis]